MSGRRSLIKDKQAEAVQAFPLTKGKVNLETGTHSDVMLIRCIVDGDITVNWDSESNSTISCVVGDDYSVDPGTTIEIVSGKFHLA